MVCVRGWGRGRATGGAGCRQGWWMEEEWGAGPDAGFYGPRETPGPTQSGRPPGRPHYRINLLRTGACISVLAACSNAQTSGSAAQRSQAPAVSAPAPPPCPSRACAARTAELGCLAILTASARSAGGGLRAGRACRAVAAGRGAHAWRRRQAAARNLADLCAMPDPGPWWTARARESAAGGLRGQHAGAGQACVAAPAPALLQPSSQAAGWHAQDRVSLLMPQWQLACIALGLDTLVCTS